MGSFKTPVGLTLFVFKCQNKTNIIGYFSFRRPSPKEHLLGIIKLTVWGGPLKMQVYGKFEGFPLNSA